MAGINTSVLADVHAQEHYPGLPKGMPMWDLAGIWPGSQVSGPLPSPALAEH